MTKDGLPRNRIDLANILSSLLKENIRPSAKLFKSLKNPVQKPQFSKRKFVYEQKGNIYHILDRELDKYKFDFEVHCVYLVEHIIPELWNLELTEDKAMFLTALLKILFGDKL